MAIVQSLINFLQNHFSQARQRNPKSAVRPILIGPPSDILQSMFALLTNNGLQDWQLSASTEKVAVLFILGSKEKKFPSLKNPPISRECQWDYAISVRNSYPLVLLIVDPSAWDSCPESLVNTTEVLGFLQPDQTDRWFNNPLWENILWQISNNLKVDIREVRDALNRLVNESHTLDVVTRATFIWQVADTLLSPIVKDIDPKNFLAFGVGFPNRGLPPRSVPDADKVLRRLAEFIKKQGLSDGIDKLKGTSTATKLNLQSDLDMLQKQISTKSLTGVGFGYSPIWHYRPGLPVPAWWQALTVNVIENLLDEVDEKPQSQLVLTCENAFNKKERPSKEPMIVTGDVHLRASTSDGHPANGVTFQRRETRGVPVSIASVPGDDSACVDPDRIPHDKPIKYTADVAGFRPGTCDVLILDSFGCKGTAHIKDAGSNPPPSKSRKQITWNQEIVLYHSGAIEIDIFHSSSVSLVTLASPILPTPLESQASSGQAKVSFIVSIEGDTTFTVKLFDQTKNQVGEWVISILIQEAVETARTRFDALIKAHRETISKVAIPSIPDSLLLRIETAYIGSADSWKPVIACWSRPISLINHIVWNKPSLGDIYPELGLPPEISIPGDLLTARNAIRQYLQGKKKPIEEIDLDGTDFGQLVETYVQEYINWLGNEPEKACWMDCIAVYVAKINPEAGDFITSEEPVAIILSPLHPLKIGWQALAQQNLVAALDKRCPAAGLLTPSTCPDIGGWTLAEMSKKLTSRAYLAVACDNPYWGLLWNRQYLEKSEEKRLVLDRLEEIGLETRAITGGFSRSQTLHSIDDIALLLPSRATLRIGVIGNNDSSSALSDGVIEWCQDLLGEEKQIEIGPNEVEIYDMRGATEPSAGKLAILSEQTQEKVRWFRIDNVPIESRLDLVILDQLGMGSQNAIEGSRRSPLGAGGLFRTRIRQDFEDAAFAMETRVGKKANLFGGLAGLLEEATTVFEELAVRDLNISQFRFRPNQQAIGRRLEQSTYLAITSSQLDPGGIIRGVTGQQGYLWDYELPGILGAEEESAGYYLLAKPLVAMKDAIRNSASLVAKSAFSDSQVQEIIQEISRRGIPILKRLASGGSQSRGELGLLLGTRLIQDSFRDKKTCCGLPVWSGDCIHLILPVDPYDEPFEKIRYQLCGSKASSKRPDLLVVAIKVSRDNPVALKITPVEVKFRGDSSMPYGQLQDALDQASNLGMILDAAWVQTPINELWDLCCSALLAECLDFAFRIYANPSVHQHSPEEWAEVHEAVLADVLNKQAAIIVNASGRLIVFDQSSITSLLDIDNDGRQDTVVVCPTDANHLLCGDDKFSPNAIIPLLDFSFPSCLGSVEAKPESIPAKETVEVAVVQPPALTEEPKKEPSEVSVPPTPTPTPTPTTTPPVVDIASKSSSSLVPEDIRKLVNNVFDGFIGNEAAVRLIKNDILSALIDKPPHLSKNFMFTGEPSTGKTELARRIALALNLPFVKLDGRGLVSRERLFELVNGELSQQGLSPSQVGQQSGLPLLDYPPLIIFVDEVHLMPKSIQESLLTVLETVDRTVTLKSFVARMTKTTFLFATTRPSEVDKAFRSRCSDVALREYTVEEVAEMLKGRFPNSWSQEVYLKLAKLGRRVPRVAISLAKDLETAIKVSEHPEKSVEEHLEDVRITHEMDETGLKPLDIHYLEVLKEEGKPVGEQSMVNLLATADKDRITDEVEPFLRKLGFIRFGGRGREITEKGANYLLALEKKKGQV